VKVQSGPRIVAAGGRGVEHQVAPFAVSCAPTMSRHFAAVAVLAIPLAAQTYVRTHDDVVEQRSATGPAVVSTSLTSTTGCGMLAVAWDGQAITGGGSLQAMAFMNPACINRAGQMAFVASTYGSSRNQGVFVADAAGLRPIAIGCGNGGGSGQPGTCGDPTPIGGTFAGFFGGTVFAPPINSDGDVLFFADVVNGSSTRGLFLWIAAAQTIVKVAVVGDPCPTGGTFAMIGPGSLNNSREIAFLASNTVGYYSDLFLWSGGTVSKIAAAGDVPPGGGSIAMLGTETFGFVDGTTIPIGPVPAINDCGQIAYRAILNSGIAGRGILVRSNGVDAWYLKDTDVSPNGGAYFDFQGPAINGSGDIAVFSDYRLAGQPTSGWFVGHPGAFRHAMSFFDPVDGGQCLGLAFSRNPMTPLDDEGNLVMWTDISMQGGQDRLVVSAPDGSLTVLARIGTPTPLGGTFGGMDAWPSLSSTGRATVTGRTPGATTINGHFAAVMCGPALAVSPCSPIGGTLRIDDYGPATAAFMLGASTHTGSTPIPPFGTLEIGPSPLWILLGPIAYPGISGPQTVNVPIPNNPALQGVSLHFQSLALTSPQFQFTNSASFTVR
jgi:hypothetical protein